MSPRRAATAAVLLAACGTSTADHQKEPPPGKEAPRPVVAPRSPGGTPAARPEARGAPAGPERPIYSLIDNRLAAHLGRAGGLLLAAGSAGFAKYIRIGDQLAADPPTWLLRQREGDAAVARMPGRHGQVFVPLTREQAERGTISVRVHSAEPGVLRLRIFGGEPIMRRLPTGWSTQDFAAPEQLREGENAIELIASTTGLAVEWIAVGAAGPRPAGEALQFYDAAQAALVIPRAGRMSWYVAVPERARLVAGVAGCAVRVLATADTGATIEGTLAGPRGAVELGPLAGRAARIDLEAASCPGEPAATSARLTGATIAVPGAAPAVARGAPPKHVLFLILDSLRFDRVRAFNPAARAETPTLDRLAAASTVFLGHYVQGNESQVSHASMWTSAYLVKHRAARFDDEVPAELVTIDEIAKRAGKYALGITGNGYVRMSRGFGKAWDKFSNQIEDGRSLGGEKIMKRALGYLEPHKDAPWFHYLGLVDTHVPWKARQPWLDRYDPGYQGRFADGFGADAAGSFQRDLTDREKDHVRALYDSNVSYLDELVGKLIQQLQAWGAWDETMLVLTADHGDEQWEHDRVGHEAGQDETLLHVPLLIHYPPLFPAARIARGTEGIDLLPTIADALGVEPDPGWQGASLIPAAHGAHVDPGLVSSSEYERHHGARVGVWKAILAGPADPRVFDLAADPDERRNLYGEPAAVIGGRLVLDAMAQLRAHHAAWKKTRWGNAANVSARFAADLGE